MLEINKKQDCNKNASGSKILDLYLVLCLDPFCTNDGLNAPWHGSYQLVACLGCCERPTGFNRSRMVGCWTRILYFWQCGQVPSPAGGWIPHPHQASMKCCKTCWQTAAQRTNTSSWHGSPKNSTLDFLHPLFCSSPVFLPTLGPFVFCTTARSAVFPTIVNSSKPNQTQKAFKRLRTLLQVFWIPFLISPRHFWAHNTKAFHNIPSFWGFMVGCLSKTTFTRCFTFLPVR